MQFGSNNLWTIISYLEQLMEEEPLMDLYLVSGIVSIILYCLKKRPESLDLSHLFIAGFFGLFYLLYPQLIIVGLCAIISYVAGIFDSNNTEIPGEKL